MTSATATSGSFGRADPSPGERHGRRRAALTYLAVVAIVLIVWEGVKLIAGNPWREPGAPPGSPVLWNPPLRWPIASDLKLPHVWTILLSFGEPWQPAVSNENLGQYLLGAALYTWREAAIGFVLGALLGLALATIFVHVRLLERALVPYVIASQTIPIIALAPLIVFAVGQGVFAVVIIATYLTFLPVTIAMIRGLRSNDPRAIELMRSYAASRAEIYWKVRLPASLPYLFTALKISATASIVGAIIGEGPGGIGDGLGWSIINFNQQYVTSPAKLWCAIFVAALLGIAFYALVRLVELRVLRGRPEATAG